MAATIAGLAVGAVGFVAFAATVRSLAPAADVRADAIVVLTGDEERIATGVRLMIEGRARRLLISGVHPTTRVPTELKRRIHGDDQAREALVRCCVDIGHDALNTSGNADEARNWARMHGFASLIVVTSSYHLPRGIAEFGRSMPDVTLVPYPVMPARSRRPEVWWQHGPTVRLLASEYVKFIGAATRLALARLMDRPQPAVRALPPAGIPSASMSIRTAP
ncbi:MAG: YdcF family protein [Hyphomicrobiaceae bacterium]